MSSNNWTGHQAFASFPHDTEFASVTEDDVKETLTPFPSESFHNKKASNLIFFVQLFLLTVRYKAPLRRILPIHNVTIKSKNLFVNFQWTFTFCVRNRIRVSTSHLVGIWFGAAISNMPHSKKAGSTTVK